MIIDQTLFMSPMAELTTPPFRRIVRKFSNEVVMCSEMLSAAAIKSYGVRNELMMKKFPFDDPYSYQILGNDPLIMAEAASILSDRNPYAIDINMGCSAPDIVKRGYGSRLLMNMETASSIVRECRKKVRCNLSVKIRCGWDSYDEKYFVDFVRMLESEGADFIIVHPRIGKLGFKRNADWNISTLAAFSVRIPVIGNGDIKTAAEALTKSKSHQLNGVMIGRTAVQRPWIFGEIEALKKGKNFNLPDILSVGIEILNGIETELPAELQKSRGLRFLSYYTKNFLFGHSLFSSIRKCESISDMRKVFIDYFKTNKS